MITDDFLEVSPDGSIVKRCIDFAVWSKNRRTCVYEECRCLDNGHYLVAHYGGKSVVEYDENGKAVWNIPISEVHIRLYACHREIR